MTTREERQIMRIEDQLEATFEWGDDGGGWGWEDVAEPTLDAIEDLFPLAPESAVKWARSFMEVMCDDLEWYIEAQDDGLVTIKENTQRLMKLLPPGSLDSNLCSRVMGG